jgi:uroporphyrinogen decarboxylase
MTQRENLLSLYRRQGYKHAPVGFALCPALWETYKSIAGDTPMAEYFDYPEGFCIDWVPGLAARVREPVNWSRYYDSPLKAGTTFDHYGVAREPGGGAAHHTTHMRHPLEKADSLEALQAYPFPEFDLQGTASIREAVARVQAEGRAAVGGMACTIWETAWYIRGMPELMMDMAVEDEKATFLLDTITAHACQRAEAFAMAGVDILELGDDIGMQQAIMMSEEMYRVWIQPRLARVIAAAKRVKPDILVFYHTCGFVEPLIENLIEAGVEILNPVQPECMAVDKIHAQFGSRLSFNGTLGTQTTMPFGTPADVRSVVFRNLELAGARGGLFCCPSHMLEPEVPWENVKAYVAACKEFRTAGG